MELGRKIMGVAIVKANRRSEIKLGLLDIEAQQTHLRISFETNSSQKFKFVDSTDEKEYFLVNLLSQIWRGNTDVPLVQLKRDTSVRVDDKASALSLWERLVNATIHHVLLRDVVLVLDGLQ